MANEKPKTPTMTITSFRDAAIIAFGFAIEDIRLRGYITAEAGQMIRSEAQDYYNVLVSGGQIEKHTEGETASITVTRPEPQVEVFEVDPEQGEN